MYKFLCRCMFSFWGCIYLTVDLLDHFDKFMLTLLAAAKLFSKAAMLFYIPTSTVCGFQFFYILTNTCAIVFRIIIIAILSECVSHTFILDFRYIWRMLSRHVLLPSRKLVLLQKVVFVVVQNGVKAEKDKQGTSIKEKWASKTWENDLLLIASLPSLLVYLTS